MDEVRMPQFRTVLIADTVVSTLEVPVDTEAIVMTSTLENGLVYVSTEAGQAETLHGNRRSIHTGSPYEIANLRLRQNATLYFATPPGVTGLVEVELYERESG